MTEDEKEIKKLRDDLLNWAGKGDSSMGIIRAIEGMKEGAATRIADLENEIKTMKRAARIVIQRFDEAQRAAYDEDKWADFTRDGHADPLVEIRWE